MKKIISLTAVSLIAACSSGSVTPDKVYVPLNGSGTTPVAATVQGAALVLDRNAGTLTYNGDVGQISPNGQDVTFASGATMSLLGTENVYSRGFALSGSDVEFGAYGVTTDPRDVPSGDATFDGDALLVASTPGGVFDLRGDASATVDFSGDNGSVTIDGLDGTLATGIAAPESVTDFGTVSITDIALDRGALSGGTAMVTTDATTAFSGDISGNVSGNLFGPEAEEVGGSISVTGDAASITGAFIASQ